MKYTKAEVEIITLENVDIVTASEISEAEWVVIDEQWCKQHNNGNRQACMDKSKPHYRDSFPTAI